MRKVLVSGVVIDKIGDLERYLMIVLQLSQTAALQRTARMRHFLHSLASTTVDYPYCRFRQWQVLGYKCAVFEKDWVFAYEVYSEGIIIRDMLHTSLLIE